MEPRTIYIVTTNYNIQPHMVDQQPKSQEEIDHMGMNYYESVFCSPFVVDSFTGKSDADDLEKQLHAVREGPIRPFLELGHPHECSIIPFYGSMELVVSVESYDEFKKIITLEDPKISESYLRTRFPEDFTRFDLVFNYHSNFGAHDTLLGGLVEDNAFEVVQLQINRPRHPERSFDHY